MKAIYSSIIASSAIMTLAGCTGMRLTNSYALSDDIYYDGTQQPAKAEATPVKEAISQNDVESYNSRLATYSRTNQSSTADTRDFSSIQQYYANANATNGAGATIEEGNRTLVVDTTDTADGYWVGGFDGTDADQTYAERIIRFHGPFVSTSYYSPLYTRARYSGDWNVYVDNYGSTYLVPTWSNPWYDDFYWGFGWNWGWHGFSFGWNKHWGWDWSWHYNWGWHSPYSYHAWGWGSPYWHHSWDWGYYHHHYYAMHHAAYGHWGHFNAAPRYRASRAQAAPASYAKRSSTVTANPNSERAAGRYSTNRNYSTSGNRSYTRTVDGSSTSNTGNTRRSTDQSNTGRYSTQDNSTNRNAQTSSSTANRTTQAGVQSGNTRRTTVGASGSTHSTYTPSSGNTRVTQRQSQNSRSYQSNRGSSYTPSGNNSRSNSGTNSSSRSYSSRSNRSTSVSGGRSSGSSHSSGSYSGGRSSSSSYSGGRSSGGGHSSGGGRGGSSSGGGRGR